MNPKTFVSILIGLQILAAIAYAVQKDSRHALYWLSAALLNISVTF